jgi:hypothetical protein
MIEIVDTVVLPCTPAVLSPWIEDLAAYPRWMALVHRAVALGGDPPGWSVDLRARLGPLARSKRLRMVRTVHEPLRRVRFERAELDGREHGRWVLAAEFVAVEPGTGEPAAEHGAVGRDAGGGATNLVVSLRYEGGLWTAGLLDRALADEIERAKVRLAALVSAGADPRDGGPTR